MSEYQYYEFCSLNSPITSEALKEMSSLSSRAKIGTHGAVYVYNFGDFRGNPEKLVLKYFDVFFYIANWGTIRLLFKYHKNEINFNDIKKYCIKDAITCKQEADFILFDLRVQNEEGFGWTEGEGILPDLLPLYDEIKSNYQILKLISAFNDEFSGESKNLLKEFISTVTLTPAQKVFLENTGITA